MELSLLSFPIPVNVILELTNHELISLITHPLKESLKYKQTKTNRNFQKIY